LPELIKCTVTVIPEGAAAVPGTQTVYLPGADPQKNRLEAQGCSEEALADHWRSVRAAYRAAAEAAEAGKFDS